mgnify:FL=1|jgi:hypothetical protein
MINVLAGFPQEIEIGESCSLDSLEYLMLRLDNSKAIHQEWKDQIMDIYKKVRAQYLDKTFEWNSANLEALQASDRRLMQAVNDTYQKVANIMERELDAKEADRLVNEIRIHLEVWGVPFGMTSNNMSEQEIEFWDLLFSEGYRDEDRNWGIGPFFHIETISESAKEHLKEKMAACEDIDDKGLHPMFYEVKDKYQVAWQDMAGIGEYYLTLHFIS